MNQPQHEELNQETVKYCHWHPDVETGLSCSQCGKSVCTQCMVQAHVGIRCRECGKAVRMPTFDVGRGHYARAIGVGAGVVIGGGLLWALANFLFGGIPFVPSLIAVGIGWCSGELISRSVNRKRGKGLAWIAACSVVGAFLVSWQTVPFSFSVFGLLFIGFGVYTAVQKVR